jgi:hypothetical protein
MDTLPSGVLGGSRSALAVSSFRLRARVGVSIPSACSGQRGITPAFGYGAPHLSTRGTSTLLNIALLSTHYGLLRLLRARPGGLWSPSTARYRHPAETWRSPTFVGNPSESVPRARDSGGSRVPRIAVLGVQPSVVRTTSASATRVISELNPRGPPPCCLRFTSPVARRRCKTRYRPARYGVDRAGFSPAGLHSGVSRAHVRSSPATLFRGATQPTPQRESGAGGRVLPRGEGERRTEGPSAADAKPKFEDVGKTL